MASPRSVAAVHCPLRLGDGPYGARSGCTDTRRWRRRMTSMSRARTARRIAAGAAYGGGGIGLVGAAAMGLLLAGGRAGRGEGGNGTTPHVPQAAGRYGHVYATVGEPPLRLVMLGDS